MENFWIVTLFHLQPSTQDLHDIEAFAINDCAALGIEEFTLNEAEVDEILGERSYSGGDLPETVLDEVEQTVLSKPGNFRFFFNDEKKAHQFLQKARTDCLCESQIEAGVSEDWNAEWKKHYSPITVNSQLDIIPSWMTDHVSKTDEKIFINPGMGFGTGSHETTFLCLKLFTEHLRDHDIQKVLDFGSGSGILGLATFKFFPAVKVDFFDIDPEANKNCFENASINGLADKPFRLLLPEYRDRMTGTYDLVFANILESILMQECRSLIQYTAQTGHLILSGLLRHQVPGIIETYKDQGMELIEASEKGDWAALIFRKNHA